MESRRQEHKEAMDKIKQEKEIEVLLDSIAIKKGKEAIEKTKSL